MLSEFTFKRFFFSLRFQRQISVNEAHNRSHTPVRERMPGKQAHTSRANFGTIFRLNAHLRQQRNRRRIVGVQISAPIVTIELNHVVVEFKHAPVGKINDVLPRSAFQRTLPRQQRNRVKRQFVLVLLRGEIGKHTAGRPALLAGLHFDVNQEISQPPLEARFDQHVHAALFVRGSFTRAFLLDELQRSGVEINVNFGEKQLDEVGKTNPQQFFEELIVIHRLVLLA